eukprot:4844318-Pleurochrysis_carterae.AAC.1
MDAGTSTAALPHRARADAGVSQPTRLSGNDLSRSRQQRLETARRRGGAPAACACARSRLSGVRQASAHAAVATCFATTLFLILHGLCVLSTELRDVRGRIAYGLAVLVEPRVCLGMGRTVALALICAYGRALALILFSKCAGKPLAGNLPLPPGGVLQTSHEGVLPLVPFSTPPTN